MMFNEWIKQLREERQIPQRRLAAELEIDTATYCKIEKDEWRVKREQVIAIAKLLKVNLKKLFTLWLANKIVAAIGDEKELTGKALKITQQNIR
ncbi:MAG: helix-turn-helix domain-containing protein [Endomicrobium sp.]|jgi:DNA-binding XRE family transcriptional regulator|nr:helix-turn-helix domain-containing protein [Endomicrobium sp.]